MVSCGDLNTWRGAGQSGSASPGAAAQMNVRLRDWDTPKLPALRTPNRTLYPISSNDRSVRRKVKDLLCDTKLRTFSKRK
jgi:hypothetical protein